MSLSFTIMAGILSDGITSEYPKTVRLAWSCMKPKECTDYLGNMTEINIMVFFQNSEALAYMPQIRQEILDL